MTPKLGFITKQKRTQKQHDHAAACERRMLARTGLAVPTLASGQAVRLFDAWKDPAVVADVGFIFPRFHQLTGSCVGAGGGQALFTLIAVQRLLSVNPTKAYVPFWPYDYGTCRAAEGDRGQGEGAMGSSFADVIVKYGVLSASEQGLPAFQNDDGLVITSSQEMAWSDGNSSLVTKWNTTAIKTPVQSAAQVTDVSQVKAAIINGYPCSFACNNYIGNGSVQSGVLLGRWDGRGGHQQSIHAYWEHADLGPLYWAQNNWPKESYPTNPDSTCPPCGVWVKEADVTAAFRLDSEVYAFSHIVGFPAQPQVLDWAQL